MKIHKKTRQKNPIQVRLTVVEKEITEMRSVLDVMRDQAICNHKEAKDHASREAIFWSRYRSGTVLSDPYGKD